MAPTPRPRRRATRHVVALTAALLGTAGCYRRSGIPPLPTIVPAAADSSGFALARALAPVLYVQRDEYFPLERVVAVVHPRCPIVAYVLDWKWDVNGQWVPWSKTSDEEEVWVGFDSASHQATDLWTYWHGTILHTDWRGRGQPAVSIQWGKHGSLPHGVIESDLPGSRSLNVMYALEYVLLPDIWLGKLVHGGPWGFFHGYGRYRDFSRVINSADRLNAVLMTATPVGPLRSILGRRFANKRPWPSTAPGAECPSTTDALPTHAP